MGMRADPSSTTTTSDTCNIPSVDKFIHEIFHCDVCDQRFATQAALRAHVFKMHMDTDTKQVRQCEVDQQKRGDVAKHAHQGLPWCRYCKHRFSGWPALQYHINSQSCAEYRAFLQIQDPSTHSSNTPLAEREEIFRAAQESWQTVSLHHMVHSHLNHCPECHLWCARPQYVRRLMQRKHPALVDVIRTVEQQVRDSNIGLQNPCQFCGQAYKARRQHLSSCAGIFARHYLKHRLCISTQEHGRGGKQAHQPRAGSGHRSCNSSNP